MNSFILHFRPWLLVLAALVFIEFAYYVVVQPSRIEWNNFIELRFSQEDSVQRIIAYEKILAAEHEKADIIQVGDSSGLHGVQPPIVMSYIPGYNYLNLGVATTLGYSGYYNMAKLQLQHNPNARYLVLYTNVVGSVPRKMLWDDDQQLMSPLLYNEFLNPLHRLFQLPTLAARKDITNTVYYLDGRFKEQSAPLSTNRGYLAFASVFRESNGWVRETDVPGDFPSNIYKNFSIALDMKRDSNANRTVLRTMHFKVTDEKFFNWWTLSYISYFDYVYDAFADLAKIHGVKLILIFNPLPESMKRPEFDEIMDWNAIAAGLDRLRERHPEVIVTNFDFWPDDKFSAFSHIETPYSQESSHRVGMIMKEIIGSKNSTNSLQPISEVPTLMAPVVIDFAKPYCGYGWTDSTGSTDYFPLQYVGPRNKTWLYTSLSPNSAYTIRSIFRSDDPEVAQRLQLKANDMPSLKLASGKEEENFWVEWLVSKDIINMYGGWMTLEFDFGSIHKQEQPTKTQKRTISFLRVTTQIAS